MSHHAHHLTAQTSSTGTIVGHECTLTGFFWAVASSNADGVLALRDSTGTVGSTLATFKFTDVMVYGGSYVKLPPDGIRFKNGLTVSDFTGMHSVTFTYQ